MQNVNSIVFSIFTAEATVPYTHWHVYVPLEVGDRFLHMTHRVIIVSNCGKYLQNPFRDKKVMDRTQHIPSNRQC
jgi:hypothetical protein